ncbi:MAG: transposase [Bryobacterales bacterium]|nr:transposase [Bryobacterales bacterium]
MTKYKVQFQKGQSLPEFLALYGAVTQCQQAVFAARWPKGFLCPSCGQDKS